MATSYQLFHLCTAAGESRVLRGVMDKDNDKTDIEFDIIFTDGGAFSGNVLSEIDNTKLATIVGTWTKSGNVSFELTHHRKGKVAY